MAEQVITESEAKIRQSEFSMEVRGYVNHPDWTWLVNAGFGTCTKVAFIRTLAQLVVATQDYFPDHGGFIGNPPPDPFNPFTDSVWWPRLQMDMAISPYTFAGRIDQRPWTRRLNEMLSMYHWVADPTVALWQPGYDADVSVIFEGQYDYDQLLRDIGIIGGQYYP